MADEPTTTTTLTELVAAEVVSTAIKDYLIDANVIIPRFEFASIAGRGTKSLAVPRWVKESAGVDITEGTEMDTEDLETLDVSITVAQVGVNREITDFAAETVNIGPQALFNFVMMDGVALCLEMAEDDGAAQFASLTGATVGTSGSDLTVANFVEALAKMRTINARGRYTACFDDQAAYDLLAAIAASTGTVFANASTDQSLLNARSDGVMGSLFGVECTVSNLTDTANTGADVVSAMWVDPASNPGHCPFTFVQLWGPRLKTNTNVDMPSWKGSTTMAYGVGTTHAAAGVKIVTDA